jgi:hypothetical protein
MKSRASAIAFAAAALLAPGCEKTTSSPRTDASIPANPAATFKVDLAPARQLDMVFMIDNSAMAPKLAKMNAQFPNLLTALRDPTDGKYPDLRIAMIDSDLGTGGQYASGFCGPNADNGYSPWGDLGKFQMRGAAACGVSSGALWLEHTNGHAVNYNVTKDISQVFACLSACPPDEVKVQVNPASAIGTSSVLQLGCS